jgi:hypothetical protein
MYKKNGRSLPMQKHSGQAKGLRDLRSASHGTVQWCTQEFFREGIKPSNPPRYATGAVQLLCHNSVSCDQQQKNMKET